MTQLSKLVRRATTVDGSLVTPIQIQPRFALTAFDARPVVIGGFTLTGRSAVPVGCPTLDGWTAAFHFATSAHEASPYWLADLLAYSTTRAEWREKMSQAQSVTGLSKQHLQNLAAVGRHVGLAERAISPSVSHSVEVVSLDRDTQRQLLEEAVTEGWSTFELRQRVKRVKSSTILEGRAETMYTVDVLISVSVKTNSPYLAERAAWELLKNTVAGVATARVISAKAK